jgi:hypothetical protein
MGPLAIFLEHGAPWKRSSPNGKIKNKCAAAAALARQGTPEKKHLFAAPMEKLKINVP